MNLKGEVIELRNCGGCIEIVIQAKVGRAEWKQIERQTFRVDDTVPNRKAFHVGRLVRVRIDPQ